MNISVHEGVCWVCGEKKGNMTRHHTIPQHLNPVKNVVVPVCQDCHTDINSDDVAGLYSFAHKLTKRLDQVHGEVRAFKSLIENLTMNRIKKD